MVPFILFCYIILLFAAFKKEDQKGELIYISPSEQRSGDSASGYHYLVTGDFLKSGFPYDFFMFTHSKGDNLLGREGKNANVEQGFNVVKNEDSLDIVIPTCMQCHSQVFEGKLYPGLGNAEADFTSFGRMDKRLSLLNMWKTTEPKKYRAVSPILKSMLTVDPLMETEVRGVNVADRLAALLVAHRDPMTLAWSDTPLLKIPEIVIPTDVPAWWLLRKKNSMFYTGFGRGDFSRFLMMSNLLTVRDSSEAREVYSHFGDVLAYIRSLKPPPYPKPVNKNLADSGEKVFTAHCQNCHGTYGEKWTYPNVVVPGHIIRTDSALYLANQQEKPFIDWFYKSWFAQGPEPAILVPFSGYIAPPLDGIWITAPYLHNGSVPTLEALLNSKLRPTYWSRDFSHPEYDYSKVGWKYETQDQPNGKKVYNTTLPGYGNYGHYFGDKLTDNERKAVIEYLKTL